MVSPVYTLTLRLSSADCDFREGARMTVIAGRGKEGCVERGEIELGGL